GSYPVKENARTILFWLLKPGLPDQTFHLMEWHPVPVIIEWITDEIAPFGNIPLRLPVCHILHLLIEDPANIVKRIPLIGPQGVGKTIDTALDYLIPL